MSLPKDLQCTYTRKRTLEFHSVQTADRLSSTRNTAHLTDVIPCVATVWVCFQWRHLTGCVAHSQPSERSIRKDADCCFTGYLHVMQSGTNWGREKSLALSGNRTPERPARSPITKPTNHAYVSRTERERSSCMTQNKFSRSCSGSDHRRLHRIAERESLCVTGLNCQRIYINAKCCGVLAHATSTFLFCNLCDFPLTASL